MALYISLHYYLLLPFQKVKKMEITFYTEKDRAAYQEFVMYSSKASFYHRIEWKEAIEKVYGLPSFYILAKSKNNIKGIFPLFLMRDIFYKKILISLPYSNYGGIVAESMEVAEALLKRADYICKKNGAVYLEQRTLYPLINKILLNKLIYFSLILELDHNPSNIWKKKVKRGAKKAVRQAIKYGLKAQVVNSTETNIKLFYDLYSKSIRDLGTPVHSFKWFKILAKLFKNDMLITFVYYTNKPIAGILFFSFKNTILAKYGASDRQFLNYRPNNLSFWTTIDYACRNNYKILDFTRSRKEQGTYYFKTQWGAKPHQVYYQYILNKISQIPHIDPSAPRYQRLTQVWQRLPLSLTRLIGPPIRKRIPA